MIPKGSTGVLLARPSQVRLGMATIAPDPARRQRIPADAASWASITPREVIAKFKTLHMADVHLGAGLDSGRPRS